MTCPFCEVISTNRFIDGNDLAVVIDDNYPVSLGHSLVIPRRHAPDFFKLTPEEQAAVWDLVQVSQARLATKHHPDGFNVGLNDGEAAGQTVPHPHVHVIPRYKGDVPDPRGGVRWVVSQKAVYWKR